MNIKDIYEKYIWGDSITDEELKFGIKELSILEGKLRELGPVFHLAWKEIYRVLTALNEYKRARK